MQDAPNSSDQALLLKRDWSQRAESPSRDFYVASHPGWQDPGAWQAQGANDANLMLHGLSAEWLEAAEALEIGCGVGRLAPHLLKRVAAYSGFDIAPAMVAEAHSRNVGLDRARFFESDGLRVPGAARDRRYDLVFALAVFIHCPKDVIIRLASDAFSLLRRGGLLRFQLLANPSDSAGLDEPKPAVEQAHEQMAEQALAAPPDEADLKDGNYMGHTFGFQEAREVFASLGGEMTLYRFDLGHIYGEVRRDTNPVLPTGSAPARGAS